MNNIEQIIDRFKQNGRFPIGKNRLYSESPNQRFDSHYIYHTAWAARIVAKTRPRLHIDIASSLYFNILVSAFVPIEFYDYRPVQLELDGFEGLQANITSLSFRDKSVSSLSCMHVVEHIGLGRYGEPIDPNGDLKAIEELKRVMRGDLLFVVPVGRAKLIFNAHRIYSYEQILSYFAELRLVEFALITDAGEFINQAIKEMADKQVYGCGCFLFRND